MSVTGDTILEQVEFTYDAGGNVIETVTRRRYHNAPASQTGELKNPSETPKARVTYSASYPDPLGRTQAAVNYGTNGGSVLSRPATIPAGSDDVLVTRTAYDAAGNTASTTDASGMVTEFTYDNRGRETSRVMNPVTASSSSSSSSGGCSPSADENVTVETAYNADGNVSSITAKNASTGDQVTQYVYGTTLSDSAMASSLLKRKEIYPDSTGDSDAILFEYNRQRQVTQQTDQGGTVHEFDYDTLGRQIHDRVTALGTGVNGAVRRISTEYEVRGMRARLTSYDNADAHSNPPSAVVNEVQFTYNDFGQLTTDCQSHSGPVNTSTTPKVQYGYANGSANTIRPTTLTYPDGRVVTYDYGSSGSMADALSRIASIIDDDVSSTHLVDYAYLGLSTFAETDCTEPQIKYTLIGTAGGNEPDTGDIYRGLDRFGRIKDSYWYDYGSAADVDRLKYGYDRAGNRLWRENVVARSLGKEFDELYTYDAVHRLKDMSRGTLNSGRTALTSETFAQCWGLDETGNWSNFREDDDGDGSWNLNQNRTANKVNEITDVTESTGPSWVTPAYSAAGNMTTVPKPADPTASFTATYDAWNRLVKLVDTSSSNTVAEYEYDAVKRRVIQKSYSGGTLDETRHLFYTEPSKWQVIEERVDSDTDPNRQFVWGLRYIDDLVLRDRDTIGNGTLDERRYALQDAHWNVTATTGTGGTAQQRMAYQAYGTAQFLSSDFTPATNLVEWTHTFSGAWQELSTSLYTMRHRTYSSVVSSWNMRDTLPDLLSSASLYAYCSSRPIQGLDPLGLSTLTECDAMLQSLINEGSMMNQTNIRQAMNCNANIFCSPGCGGGAGGSLTGLTFVESGRIHVCINANHIHTEQQLLTILIHEAVHVSQLIGLDRKLCCKDQHSGWPPAPPPLGTPSCDTCIAFETAAYQAMCNYMYSDRANIAACIQAGRCHSCGHVCPDLPGPDGGCPPMPIRDDGFPDPFPSVPPQVPVEPPFLPEF